MAEAQLISTETKPKTQSDCDNDVPLVKYEASEILDGTTVERDQIFTDKNGSTIKLTPILVDFRLLLQLKSSRDVVPGVKNSDLLHAVVGLYDVTLSDMTPDVIYASTCDKHARTIILIQDLQETIFDLRKRLKEEGSGLPLTPKNKLPEIKEDIYRPVLEKPCTFADVYSDEESESDASENDDDQDYSYGINSFLTSVHKRKTCQRNENSDISDGLGIEDRIVAAATFEKKFCNRGERVVHLTLMAVRKRHRKCGIGRYLVSKVKDSSLVGSYDAVVVHAENSAMDFFERYGFSDDMVLNSRWRDLAEQFTNCTLMSYLPPFTTQSTTCRKDAELDIIAMEKEIKKWRDKSVELYQAELSCVMRMRHEIIHLRALAASQQELISSLQSSNQQLRHNNLNLEKRFLEYKMCTEKAAFSEDQFDDEETEESTEQLIQQLERASKRGNSLPDGDPMQRYRVSNSEDSSDCEPYDHGKDMEIFFRTTHDFYSGMKADTSLITMYEVKMVSKAILPSSVIEAHQQCISTLSDPATVTRLYYCGSVDKSSQLTDIIRRGFTEEDFTQADYGRGLYFSKFPSKAAQFSVLGKLIVADVGLGEMSAVMKEDPTIQTPTSSSNSIITPGRLKATNESESVLCQEYVIFDHRQALPYALVDFAPVCP